MGCRLSRTISQPDLASPSSPDGRSGGQRNKKDSGGMLGGPGMGKSAGGESPSRGRLTNGQSVLHRRDTPANNLLENILNSRNNSNNTNGNGGGAGGGGTFLTGGANGGAGAGNDPLLPAKPIGQVESASQADFFRMLDEKIAQGPGDLAESPHYDD